MRPEAIRQAMSDTMFDAAHQDVCYGSLAAALLHRGTMSEMGRQQTWQGWLGQRVERRLLPASSGHPWDST
jgi:hypothetical protein